MDWTDFRALFPATRELAYLNCGTFAPAALPVLAALDEMRAGWSSGRGAWLDWEAGGERAREACARLLGVEPASVALLPDVAAAAAQVAERLPCPPGANLVVGAGEFRSNLYPWLNQERRGFELRVVPVRAGRMPVDAWLAAIDDRTACVAVSSVQSASGYRVQLDALKEACARRGARLFVDATQSAGVLDLDPAGIDYLAAAGYKWLLGPRGCAYLRVAPERLGELEPLSPGWKAAADPYAEYYGPPLDLAERASKLDHSLAWLPWAGAAAGLELLLEQGPARVERRALGLAERFCEGLAELGLAPLFDAAERAQLVALTVPDADRARAALRAADVIAAVRGPYLRVGFHAFNDESDAERALAALASAALPGGG